MARSLPGEGAWGPKGGVKGVSAGCLLETRRPLELAALHATGRIEQWEDDLRLGAAESLRAVHPRG